MVRPRSIEAHEKVLNAALALFAERGIEATSMDAISQASGVSKATIYNHWADKEALLLEVMLMVNGPGGIGSWSHQGNASRKSSSAESCEGSCRRI
jgi:hypothetical protein